MKVGNQRNHESQLFKNMAVPTEVNANDMIDDIDDWNLRFSGSESSECDFPTRTLPDQHQETIAKKSGKSTSTASLILLNQNS